MRPLVGAVDVAYALGQQLGCTGNAGMGDPQLVAPWAGWPGIPGRRHPLHEVLYRLAAARAVLGEVGGPVGQGAVADGVPALAFPGAKVHLPQAGIKMWSQIRP